MRRTALALVAFGTSLLACNGNDGGTTKEASARKWNCVPLAVQDGETVMCMASRSPSSQPLYPPDEMGAVNVRTYQVPGSGAPSGGGEGSGESSESAGSADESAPTGPATSAPPEEYDCSAGGENCPPASPPAAPSPSGESSPTAPEGTYKCTSQSDITECTKKEIVCKEGTMPARTGDKCVPVAATGGTTAPQEPAPSPTPTSAPGDAPGFGTLTSNCFEVGLVAQANNADGSTTWTYRVLEHECAQDLSNWVLGTGNCNIVGGSPKYELVHPDPNAGLYGVKWETGDGFADGLFTITTTGASRGSIKFATKGPGVAWGVVDGPVCK